MPRGPKGQERPDTIFSNGSHAGLKMGGRAGGEAYRELKLKPISRE
jgi:hypothetical protein